MLISWIRCTLNQSQHHLPFLRAMSSVTEPPGLLAIFDKSPKRKKRISFMAELFKADGFELRIAGGAVRDILLGTEPKDIDFATNALPQETLSIFTRHEDILRIIVTNAGQRHGTIAVKFKEGDIDFKKIKLAQNDVPVKQPLPEPEYDSESPYEVTTLRCDVETDGRHAEVKFINDWKLDAERRDLTINAMFLTLDEGKLVDYYNGESDLRNGVVKFVGDADKRLKEDYLRILRYFRFWSRYGRGNQPDQATKDVIRANLDGLAGISGERIWSEIKKIFSNPPCHDVFELMVELNLLQQIGATDAEIEDLQVWSRNRLDELDKVEENIKTYKSKLSIDLIDGVTKKIEELLPVILFASTLSTETMCHNARDRMKFSNQERDSILFIIAHRDGHHDLRSLRSMLALSPGSARQQTLNKIRSLLIYKGQLDLLNELKSMKIPEFPINGILVSKEVKRRKLPGTHIKVMMQDLLQLWVDNDYNSSGEELMKILESKLDDLSAGSR